MGCDIHLKVEWFDDKRNRWWKCKDGLKSDYYDENSDYFSQNTYKNGEDVYSSRNYTLFAYLANVRNGYGFAGLDTGNPIVPIDEPRGLPEDVSLAIREDYEEWDHDAHSCSYFTLGELKQAAEKAKQIIKTYRGWVGKQGFKEFKETGKPKNWSGGISGKSVRHVSNEQMEKELETDSDCVYTQVEWNVSLYENLKGFFEHVIPQLEEWDYEKRNNDEIRIVFWFDN